MHRRILNSQQKKAVTYGDGPLLIVAGAGTGKTTVVTERIVHLITKRKVRPERILALTFTEKASREMEERVDVALPYGMVQLWMGTFHGFCDRILKTESLSIGLDPNASIMTEAIAMQFFKSNLFSLDLSYFRPLGNPNKFIAGMLQHFSRLKDEDISPGQYMEWVNAKQHSEEIPEEEWKPYEELARAYRTYEELKVKNGKLDYADLISNTLQLFRKRPAILKRYQDQFDYILIDEFQDTNFAQNELAILLAGTKRNITVVGDDDQAIYRWRGAALSNIIQFRKRFPDAHIVVLSKNYRSTRSILDSSYRLITHNNPDRLEVREKINKKLQCVRKQAGIPVRLFYEDRVENEADRVVKEILRLREGDGQTERFDWKDIAILVRANAHAEPFIRALSRSNIPFQFLGPGQLFRQAEVKDLICYLRVLYDIRDNVSLFRVLSMDHFHIPGRDIALAFSVSREHGLSLFEGIEHMLSENPGKPDAAVDSGSPVGGFSREGRTAIRVVMGLLNAHLQLVKKESAGQILYRFLSESGILQAMGTYKTTQDEKRADNIAKFFDRLKTYEAQHEDASVFPVVEWLMLSMEVGESPQAANTDWTQMNAVNIVTVHSAKGLEFPVVFLVNLTSGRFPSVEKHEQIPIPQELVKEILPEGDYHIQEERRLFYVGMTRARDRLYFSAAKYYGEGKRERKISLFVGEATGVDLNSLQAAPGPVPDAQLRLLDWKDLPKEDTDSVRPPLHYLSYSQLDTFKTCPLQYKYRYVIRIPVPPSAALSFGDTIHRTLHAFYTDVAAGGSGSLEALLSLYEKAWKPTGYRNKEYEAKAKHNGEILLREFHTKGFDPRVTVIGLEQPFKIRLTPELTVGGKIDRIDRKQDGGLEIIDYKTGSAPKKRDVSDDLQLSVYALAATGTGMDIRRPEDITVSFYFLEGQEKLSSTRSPEQLEEVKTTLITAADRVRTSDFRPTPGKHCDFCEFRLICEAWK